jgi:two-component system, chemotaxis family, protein-glutamate methylesterase/glutaminase
MFSTLTERGASATLEALSRGATDYATKPSNQDMETTSHTVSEELIPKIKALCFARPGQMAKAAVAPTGAVSCSVPLLIRKAPIVSAPVRVVTIGVSTGGPEALARLLPTLPKDLAVPVVIAQHMPPIFTSLLASRLSTKCAVPVRECASGEPLLPGTIWIAPGDFHMVVSREDGVLRLRTNQGPRENYCRPSVDVLFRSVANIYGSKALGVILTGMGQDGLKGCASLIAGGSRVIVQDEASSVVWGMPGFVARAGLAEKILPLTEIGPEIERRVSGALRVAQ